MASKSLSRHKFRCVVGGCGKELRSDKLRNHYHSCVKFDKTGKPLAPDSRDFNLLSDIQQIHTSFFYTNGYNRNNLPSNTTPANAPTNPWAAMGIPVSTSKEAYFESNSDGESQLDIELPLATNCGLNTHSDDDFKIN